MARRAERAVHLVGGHVEEAEGRRLVRGEANHVGPRRLEELEGADQVGPDELAGAVDDRSTCDSAAKLTIHAGPVLGEEAGHAAAIADVRPSRRRSVRRSPSRRRRLSRLPA